MASGAVLTRWDPPHAEEDERLVEVVQRPGRVPLGTLGQVGAGHLLDHNVVREAELLRHLRKVGQRRRVGGLLEGGKNDASYMVGPTFPHTTTTTSSLFAC
jgi:hypothetical protein